MEHCNVGQTLSFVGIDSIVPPQEKFWLAEPPFWSCHIQTFFDGKTLPDSSTLPSTIHAAASIACTCTSGDGLDCSCSMRCGKHVSTTTKAAKQALVRPASFTARSISQQSNDYSTRPAVDMSQPKALTFDLKARCSVRTRLPAACDLPSLTSV